MPEDGAISKGWRGDRLADWESHWREELARSRDEVSSALVSKARELNELGKYREALQTIDELLSKVDRSTFHYRRYASDVWEIREKAWAGLGESSHAEREREAQRRADMDSVRHRLQAGNPDYRNPADPRNQTLANEGRVQEVRRHRLIRDMKLNQ